MKIKKNEIWEWLKKFFLELPEGWEDDDEKNSK